MSNTATRTVWTAAPKGAPKSEREAFDSEDRAFDCAFDWSIELGGDPVIIYCNGIEWAEVTA